MLALAGAVHAKEKIFLLQSPSEQTCTDAARQYVHDEYKPDKDHIVTYTTHYNRKLNVCLAQISSSLTVGVGKKTYPLGGLTIEVVDVLQRNSYAFYMRFPVDARLGNGEHGKVIRCSYFDSGEVKATQCGQIEPDGFRKLVAPLMVE